MFQAFQIWRQFVLSCLANRSLIQWIDLATGLAATAFQQIMPLGDQKAAEVNIEFEKAVYRAFGKHAEHKP